MFIYFFLNDDSFVVKLSGDRVLKPAFWCKQNKTTVLPQRSVLQLGVGICPFFN